MKLKAIGAMFIGITLSISSATWAEDKKAPGSGPSPYSDCGIGAALFPDTHWAAVLSNTIWDAGTTALTSGTMSPETCNGKNVQAAIFIHETYANLAEETAQGQGEHIASLLNIYGCSSAAHKDVITEIRSGMSKALNSPSYDASTHTEKATAYYNLTSASVSKNCTI